MPVYVIGELHSILAVGRKLLMQVSGLIVEVPAADVVVQIEKGPFGIPREEPESCPRHPSSSAIPIIAVPVHVAHVEIHEHVVDEAGDVQVFLDSAEGFRGVQALVRERHHRIPGLAVAVHGPALVLNHVVFLGLAPEVLGEERRVRSLDDVVQAPVQPVEVQVYVALAGRQSPHGVLRVAWPLVADVLGANLLNGVRMEPRVAVAASQDEGVEAPDRPVLEHGKLQLWRAIDALEQQTHVVLRPRRAAAGAALDAQSRVDVGLLASRRIDDFHRDGPLPRFALTLRVHVDAGDTVEQIGHVGCQRDRPMSE